MPAQHFRRTPGLPGVFLSLSLGLAACGEIETLDDTDTDTGGQGEEEGERPAFADAFVNEAWTVSTRWYSYNGTTHALTPNDESYLVRFDDGTASLVDVITYYTDRGVSGIFTLRLRRFDGEWSGPQLLTTAGNIKENPACINLRSLEEETCEGASDLVLRVNRHPMPPAGFAVVDPGLYFGTHRVNADGPRTVWRSPKVGATDTPLPPDELQAQSRPVRSASADPLEGALGPYLAAGSLYEHEIVTVTPDMVFAQWQVHNLEVTGGELVVELSARCANVAMTRAEQPPLQDKPTRRVRIAVPVEGNYNTALLSLCGAEGPAVEQTRNAPWLGDWPDNTTFHLVLEQVNGEPALFGGPGTQHFSATWGNPDPDPALQVLSLPQSLWDQ